MILGRPAVRRLHCYGRRWTKRLRIAPRLTIQTPPPANANDMDDERDALMRRWHGTSA